MTVQDQLAQVGGIIGDFVGSILRNPGVQTGLRLAVWGLIALWFVTVFWAFRDARARTRNWLVALGAPTGIALATPVAFPLAVVVWRILRPEGTVAEAREQQLTIEALRAAAQRPTCLGCGSTVNAEWRRCPWCRTWLQASCPRCQRLVELGSEVCPWCVVELAAGALVPQVGSPTLVPVMAVSAALASVSEPAAVESPQAALPARQPRREEVRLVPPEPATASAASPKVVAAPARAASSAASAEPRRCGGPPPTGRGADAQQLRALVGRPGTGSPSARPVSSDLVCGSVDRNRG